MNQSGQIELPTFLHLAWKTVSTVHCIFPSPKYRKLWLALKTELIMVLRHFTDIPYPVNVRAEATADNTSIRVSWEWSRQGLLICLDSVRVDYQPDRGSLMMYTVDSATATRAILSNLPCNTQYTVSVYATGGRTGKRTVDKMVSLPARGIVVLQLF